MRYGEMAAFEERPHSPYYGAVDATPLYVILLDEYERWTGDKALVRDLEREARAAINWIDQYADLMGNGYISYKRRNERTGPREPELEGLLELDLVRGRPPAGLPARDLRAPGLRLRREDPRRPAGPPRLEGRGLRGPAREGGRRPQAPVQPRLLARRSRLLRPRARRRRQPGGLAGLEQRAPAVERHRRRQQGEVRGRPPDGPAACGRAGASGRWPRARAGTTRSATTWAPCGRSTTRSSPGGCGGTGSRRRPRGSRPGSSTPPRSSTGRLPEAFGGYDRERDPVPGQVPDRVQPAGVVDRGAAAAAAHDARPRAARATTSSSTRRCRRPSGISSCWTSRAAGAASTPSGAAGSTSTRTSARPR